MTKKKTDEVITPKTFKPKTKNQASYIRSISENTITIVDGISGTGKTMLAVGMACNYLIDHKVEKILVSRSIVNTGKELGATPGSVEEKIHGHMLPLIEYFDYFLSKGKTKSLIQEEKIRLYPVELLRGHTYNNTFMILDEAQNCTIEQIRLFMSRIGYNSKMIVIGDTKQSDIYYSGFQRCLTKLDDIREVGIVSLYPEDVMRHPLIPHILEALE